MPAEKKTTHCSLALFRSLCYDLGHEWKPRSDPQRHWLGTATTHARITS